MKLSKRVDHLEKEIADLKQQLASQPKKELFYDVKFNKGINFNLITSEIKRLAAQFSERKANNLIGKYV